MLSISNSLCMKWLKEVACFLPLESRIDLMKFAALHFLLPWARRIITPPKFNMVHLKRSPQKRKYMLNFMGFIYIYTYLVMEKDIPIGNHHFQVNHVKFRGSTPENGKNTGHPQGAEFWRRELFGRKNSAHDFVGYIYLYIDIYVITCAYIYVYIYMYIYI